MRYEVKYCKYPIFWLKNSNVGHFLDRRRKLSQNPKIPRMNHENIRGHAYSVYKCEAMLEETIIGSKIIPKELPLSTFFSAKNLEGQKSSKTSFAIVVGQNNFEFNQEKNPSECFGCWDRGVFQEVFANITISAEKKQKAKGRHKNVLVWLKHWKRYNWAF